jgi:membrane peptidoglycan carboxypeptidase
MLGDAVVSVEDEHFYDNFVVNVADGAGRAALGVLQTNRDPGGSTIDQQLAKQRQLYVLDRLVVNHHLTRVRANAAYRERLPLTTARG